MGGMHLLKALKERIEKTISVLKEFKVQKIGTAHCTESTATSMFFNFFSGQMLFLFCGYSVRF
jgi:metal-dependent hydrolase (beta-lactamase superfamily II)